MISNRVRNASYQILRSLEIQNRPLEEIIIEQRQALELTPGEAQFIKNLVEGVIESREQIDSRIYSLLHRTAGDWYANIDEKVLLRMISWEIWLASDTWERCSVSEIINFTDTLALGAKTEGKVLILLRHFAREVAFRILYTLDVGGEDPVLIQEYLFGVYGLDKERRNFSGFIIEGVLSHREEIDALITPLLRNWQLDRLKAVDRVLLRIGTYEICYRTDTSAQVFINEAVELGKLYGGRESASFINGVLDEVAEKVRKGEGSRL